MKDTRRIILEASDHYKDHRENIDTIDILKPTLDVGEFIKDNRNYADDIFTVNLDRYTISLEDVTITLPECLCAKIGLDSNMDKISYASDVVTESARELDLILSGGMLSTEDAEVLIGMSNPHLVYCEEPAILRDNSYAFTKYRTGMIPTEEVPRPLIGGYEYDEYHNNK